MYIPPDAKFSEESRSDVRIWISAQTKLEKGKYYNYSIIILFNLVPDIIPQAGSESEVC